ncbi:type I restriction enzyme HsdR N-terminal domain-containing protein [Robiginitalea aurantiaca]|uniref:Type I restriction enzyme HsdR N-terminal domain-containing protein n=1 Tax=Robiginitalea aurantiaca TaxID=3056915 RepID=A0ABT7WFF2_9FLAO|nr:type I restriction enzyme HsdR N-terminal domain-containing protein [Robiginitalea aurantiaca]MDM9631649.1 type I restriction enzyme HsdR N-terminal domain-containing protein [Robiginitalea aurantiaca]
MIQLNFPKYEFRFKSRENKALIFDIIRKKYVVLTPEEWVRQHCLHFLLKSKKYPSGLALVERRLKVGDLDKRMDIAICNRAGKIELLVECKAPEINLDQKVFDQIARYNWEARADFLMVTNGLQHYYCRMDYEKQEYIFLPDLPDYK